MHSCFKKLLSFLIVTLQNSLLFKGLWLKLQFYDRWNCSILQRMQGHPHMLVRPIWLGFKDRIDFSEEVKFPSMSYEMTMMICVCHHPNILFLLYIKNIYLYKCCINITHNFFYFFNYLNIFVY